MKKLFVFALIAVMSMGISACGGNDKGEANTNANTEADASTQENDAVVDDADALANDTDEADEVQSDAAEGDTDGTDAAEGDTTEVTINLMGNDVVATVTIADGKFEASYSFNGNDVIAKGSIAEDGTMTLEEHTPETVPAEYVQAALTSIADEL